jgi:hypothetical protein
MKVKTLKDAEFNKVLLTKQEVYDIMRTYIEDQIGTARRKQISEDSFERPNWPEYQAYQCGTLKALEKVLEFIPLTEGKS